MKRVRLSTSCKVEDPASLTIVIGEGQMGASRVRLDGRQLAIGQVKDLPIGPAADAVGKTLEIKTVVTDVNDKTNRTSVRYRLRNGSSELAFDLSAVVDEEGGSAIYLVSVHLE